jgi:hypothetical protein
MEAGQSKKAKRRSYYGSTEELLMCILQKEVLRDVTF